MDNVFALAEFETPVSENPIQPLVWSTEKYTVAQMIALHGKSRAAISQETKVPLSTINSWLKHPDFQEYVKATIDKAASTMRQDNIALLTKMIAARVAEAELADDYANLSKKDTLSLIKELNDLTGESTSKEESMYAKLFEKVLMKSMEPKKLEGR